MTKELWIAGGVTFAAVYLAMVSFELTDHFVLKPHVKGTSEAALPAATK